MRFLLATMLLAILPPTRWFGLKRALLRACGIPVGARTRICGRVRFYGGGRVTIGRECWIGIGVAFYTAPKATVAIGDRCDIGPETAFNGGSHHVGSASRRAGEGISQDIAIGAGSWLGHGVTVLGGCGLGEGSVVSARALLLDRRYPASAMLVGSPARVAHLLDESGRKHEGSASDRS